MPFGNHGIVVTLGDQAHWSGNGAIHQTRKETTQSHKAQYGTGWESRSRCRWAGLSFWADQDCEPSPFLPQQAPLFAVPVARLFRLALVAKLFAAGERDFNFCPALFVEINL
jgi:hypothetical protein